MNPENRATVERGPYFSEHYQKNRKRILARNREWRKKNKERVNAHQREYRKKNKDRLATHSREYRQKNKERTATYQRDNKDHIIAQQAKYHKSFRDRFNDRYGLPKEGHEHGVCTCCKEADLTLFGTVSHIDGGGKQHRELNNGSQIRVIRDALDHYDPSRFAAECFNCNMAARRNGGICPHKTGKMTR